MWVLLLWFQTGDSTVRPLTPRTGFGRISLRLPRAHLGCFGCFSTVFFISCGLLYCSCVRCTRYVPAMHLLCSALTGRLRFTPCFRDDGLSKHAYFIGLKFSVAFSFLFPSFLLLPSPSYSRTFDLQYCFWQNFLFVPDSNTSSWIYIWA